jgi:hypothetical protein
MLLVLGRDASAFTRVPFKIICKPQECPRHFRVADLSGQATALLLNFRQGFWPFRHDGKLKQLRAQNYQLAIAAPLFGCDRHVVLIFGAGGNQWAALALEHRACRSLLGVQAQQIRWLARSLFGTG